jgi:hypothetical protein
MARVKWALLCGAVALAAACSTERPPNPVAASSSGRGGAGGEGSGGEGGAGGEGGQGGASTSTGGGGSGGAAAAKLEVGVSKQDITPVIETWTDPNANGVHDDGEAFEDKNGNNAFDPVWMAGFGNGRQALGVNPGDALEVRAIAFRSGETTVVLCVLDVVGYFIDEMDKIKADPIVQALGVDHILIGSTHTHEGVDTVGLWGKTQLETGRTADYQKLTRDKAALAIKEAVESLKPAAMRVAQTKTVDPASMSTLPYVNDVRDPIIYDPTVTIAQFTDEAEPTKTIATLVNWASHPEYAGSENTLLSADYVHWLRQVMEQGVPSESINGLGGTAVFVQGPLGGQIGPGGPVAPIDKNGMPVTMDGLAKAEAAGTNVGKLALDAIQKNAEPAASAGITLRSMEISARIENTGYHFAFQLGILDRKLYDYDETKPIDETNYPSAKTRVTYLQVGPLAMITSPGELHPELWVGGYDGSWSWGQPILNEMVNKPDLAQAPKGPYLRDLMLMNPGVKYAFTAGLVEDFLGYIVPSFDYVLHPSNPYLEEADGDHYEETNSIGPLVEEQIQHPMLELAKPKAP